MIEPQARVPVGRTGVQVSRFGIGGGSLFSSIGEDNVKRTVDYCWDAGLRYFDTAPLYAAGVSESRFGSALATRPRAEFVVSTKVGRLVRDGESVFDYSYDGTYASVEHSLERLQMAYADIVMIHDVDPGMHGDRFEWQFETAMTGAYAALQRLRSESRIRALGVAVKDWQVCLRFAQSGQFDCFMLPGGFTLLRQDSIEFLEHCRASGAVVLVAAPFNTGILATGPIAGARFDYRPASAAILARTGQIQAACGRYGVPLAAAALQFPLRHPSVASVVAGHQSAEEVEANLRLLRLEIPAELWAELEKIGSNA
jgi:D-threo-aldose 1-dehydrogenase